MKTVTERFNEKMQKQPDGCWIWMASKNGAGYGKFWTGSRLMLAHRYSYELVKGPIPDGLVLDHLCNNRACCNPAHLQVVTQRENIMRGNSMSAQHAAKSHCPKCGGEYSADKDGVRYCKPCGAAKARRRRESNPIHVRAVARAWEVANRDKRNAQARARKMVAQ